MIIVLMIFTIHQNLLIDDLNHQFLNQVFLFSYLSSFIFVILSMMFIINGLNFIDGNNGLMLGVALLILVNFAFYTEASNHELHRFVICLSLSVIALFLINFFTGKIICGDGGAYFLGFLIGVISILISKNDIIFATQIACIIFYPVFELFFTFWRRIFFEKISPFEPDDLHLHSIVYRILRLKMESKFSSNILNSMTAVLILIMLTFLSIILFYYGKQIGYLNFFFIQSFIYLIIYLHLYNYVRKI
jgi:UDP-GlcNAc:undecaprenyl-phosphate GlcNAc-1-phosphate transferase